MKKIVFIMIAVLLTVALAACGPKAGQTDSVQTGGDNVAENGQNTDAPQSIKEAFPEVDGLPEGFPGNVPIYEGAQVIDSSTFGEDGYSVVYQVKASYNEVVAFYMQAVPGMDESGIGEDESYFEAMDIDDVHINGLTIADADGSTQVFITLRNYRNSDASEDDSFETGDDVEEEVNETESDYDSIVGGKLEEGYPKDVVPIYETLKITSSSKTPDDDLYVLEGVAPPKSFDDAVAFYQTALGGSPKASESPAMKTEAFKGEKDGWTYDVYVADIYTSGNTVIQITMQK